MSADSIEQSLKGRGFSLAAQMRRRLSGKAGVGVLLAVTALLTACGTETGAPLESLAGTPLFANVSGRLTNGMDSSPVVGAAVSIGDIAASSDASGRFLLPQVPASTRVLVQVVAPGYVDGFPITNTVLGFTSSIAAQLLPVSAVAPVVVAAGGTVSVPASSASLTVAANTLVLSDATPASGSVNLAVTPINTAQNLLSMPGDFTASTGEPIESFGGIAVSGATAASAAVDLAAGQTATINIPFASRNTGTPPATLTLFSFDTTTGYWVASGTATLMGTAPSQYYQGTISHLGIWTAAELVSPSVFLNGCVTNEGTTHGVGNVRVQAEGIDYSGVSSAITGGDGKFRMAVKPNSTVIVNGQLGNYVTNTFSVSPAATEITMPECLSLAALSGAPRITLTWGVTPHDVDSHIFAPDGTHVYYSSKGTLTESPFMKLDVDDVTSFGPEVVTVTRLMVGTYTYGVRNYSGENSPGMTGSPVRVEFRQGDVLTVFTPTAAMGETLTSRWWTVFKFTVDASCNVTVVPVSIFSGGPDAGPVSPVLPAPVARQYCVSPP